MRIDYESHYDADYWTRQKTYRDAYGGLARYNGPSLEWDGFEPIADAIYRIFPSVRTALDIGCGGGDLTRRLLGRGWDIYGLDVSTFAVAHAALSLPNRVACVDVTTTPDLIKCSPSLPNVYDLVFATDFLEHIYYDDLVSTFTWLRARTKRWAFFCVATAFNPLDPLNRSVSTFIHEKGKDVPAMFEATAVSGHVHVRHFSWWLDFFAMHGFKVRWDLKGMFEMLREAHPGWKNTGGWSSMNNWPLEKVNS